MNPKRFFAGILAGLSCGLILSGPVLAAADPTKMISQAFEASDDGFDLTRTNNLYSVTLTEAIFEGLLKYDYLARPARVMPGLAEAMPEITDDGKTYLFKIRKGVYFTPDPAFKGVRREVTANDFAYAIKRHLDPKNRSVQNSVWSGKFVGADAFEAAAKKTGKFDYDTPIAGLEIVDRYTLRMRLTNADDTIKYYIASPMVGAIAREVVEAYGEAIAQHPVGTGAYMLKQYVPRSKIVLEANPDFQPFIWDFKSSGEPWDDKVIKVMKGKTMPQIGRVEISIIEEDQSRWLALDSGQIDITEMSDSSSPKVLNKGVLKPEFAAKGLQLYRFAEPSNARTFFNMKDPVVGGYTLEKIALRRAIAMAYNVEEEIAQARFGQAVRAKSHIPPGVAGFDPNYRSSITYDPELAKKLLDHYGYRKGEDGFRTNPDGSPLTLKIHSAPKTRDIAIMEVWKRSLDRVGIRAEFPVAGFADNLKAAYRCELMMFGLGGTASVPDGLDFLENYYGPKAGAGNFGCYKSAVFDEAYAKAVTLPAGKERYDLYIKMQQQMEADTVQVLTLWRLKNWLAQERVQGFKAHPIIRGIWQYLDLEKK